MYKISRTCIGCMALAVFVIATALGREAAAWHDPSHHSVKFVTVEDGVKLEVLDWGGRGRPVVLLTGIGNTAHIFDGFAEKLTGSYRVYGITRRGFGASSAPSTGYGADRLGDDVLAVIAALKLKSKPVLIGHSIAGSELSSIGTRYPEKVAGLVYLDAANNYAFDHPDGEGQGLRGSVPDLIKNLQELQKEPPDPTELVDELLHKNLPLMQRALEEFQERRKISRPSAPARTAQDLASFEALGTWYQRTTGLTFPEADLRATSEVGPDGRILTARTPASITQAVWVGVQKYRDIRAPALAIFANPHATRPFEDLADPAVRAAIDAFAAWEKKIYDRQSRAFETGVPNSRVVILPYAHHYVFLSNERDVLREIRAFTEGLSTQ